MEPSVTRAHLIHSEEELARALGFDDDGTDPSDPGDFIDGWIYDHVDPASPTLDDGGYDDRFVRVVFGGPNHHHIDLEFPFELGQFYDEISVAEYALEGAMNAAGLAEEDAVLGDPSSDDDQTDAMAAHLCVDVEDFSRCSVSGGSISSHT